MEKEPKKTGHERTRREVAAANASAASIPVNEADVTSARSEVRREAVLSRKIRQQQQHVDSDFDERPNSRKQQGKNKKQADFQGDPRAGVATGSATTGPSKRKKQTGSQSMERAASGAGPRSKPAASPIIGGDGSRKRKQPTAPVNSRKR